MQETNPSQHSSADSDTTDPSSESKARQQQSDPQLTELAGFIDPNEDLEPTLEDGTKGPEKADEENARNAEKNDND
jgi:hypothetical protein